MGKQSQGMRTMKTGIGRKVCTVTRGYHADEDGVGLWREALYSSVKPRWRDWMGYLSLATAVVWIFSVPQKSMWLRLTLQEAPLEHSGTHCLVFKSLGRASKGTLLTFSSFPFSPSCYEWFVCTWAPAMMCCLSTGLWAVKSINHGLEF